MTNANLFSGTAAFLTIFLITAQSHAQLYYGIYLKNLKSDAKIVYTKSFGADTADTAPNWSVSARVSPMSVSRDLGSFTQIWTFTDGGTIFFNAESTTYIAEHRDTPMTPEVIATWPGDPSTEGFEPGETRILLGLTCVLWTRRQPIDEVDHRCVTADGLVLLDEKLSDRPEIDTAVSVDRSPLPPSVFEPPPGRTPE